MRGADYDIAEAALALRQGASAADIAGTIRPTQLAQKRWARRLWLRSRVRCISHSAEFVQ